MRAFQNLSFLVSLFFGIIIIRSVMDKTDGCRRRLLSVTDPTNDGLLLLFKIIGSDEVILMLSIGVKHKLYVVVEQTTPTGIFL
jgi:hypothetical protein